MTIFEPKKIVVSLENAETTMSVFQSKDKKAKKNKIKGKKSDEKIELNIEDPNQAQADSGLTFNSIQTKVLSRPEIK